MTLRAVRLFDNGKATRFLRAQWAQKGALQPITQAAVLLELDRSATRLFRAIWQAAFPDRQRLPFGPVAEADGRGSDAFWEVFN